MVTKRRIEKRNFRKGVVGAIKEARKEIEITESSGYVLQTYLARAELDEILRVAAA